MYLHIVYQVIEELFGKKALTPETRLTTDLNLTGIDIVELVMNIELRLNLPSFSLRVSELEAPFTTISTLVKKIEHAKQIELQKAEQTLQQQQSKATFFSKFKQRILSICK